MPRTAMPRASAPILSLVALAALSTAAQAQPADRPGQPPRHPDAPPPPVLRGPSVEDTSIPGTARAFTMDAMQGPQNRMLNREVPMGEFLAAIRALGEPEAPADLNLSPRQRQQFQAIVRDFTQAQRQHMQSHREELTALGQTLGFDAMELGRAELRFTERLDQGERRARRAAQGQSDPTLDPMSETMPDPRSAQRPARTPEQMIRERVGPNPTPEQRAAFERLRQIRDSGPSLLEAQTAAWNILSQPQQAFVQARLDQARARLDTQRGELYVQEMSRQIEGERQRARTAPPGTPGPAAERLHRLIDQMTPQEQGMLLQFLETRWERRPGRPDAADRQPPPPAMDQIRIPTPASPDPV